MSAVMGYCDNWSVAPGDTISFKVSCLDTSRYEARIVRLKQPDAGPLATPFAPEPVDAPCNGQHDGRFQRIPCGSLAVVPAHPGTGAIRRFHRRRLRDADHAGQGAPGHHGNLVRQTPYRLGPGDRRRRDTHLPRRRLPRIYHHKTAGPQMVSDSRLIQLTPRNRHALPGTGHNKRLRFRTCHHHPGISSLTRQRTQPAYFCGLVLRQYD